MVNIEATTSEVTLKFFVIHLCHNSFCLRSPPLSLQTLMQNIFFKNNEMDTYLPEIYSLWVPDEEKGSNIRL